MNLRIGTPVEAARRGAARLLLDPMRARSNRIVCWTPDFMGYGNVLHLLHWVATERVHGNQVWALTTGALGPWLPVFPELAPLCIDKGDVRLTDRRVAPWSAAGRQHLSDALHRGAIPLDPEAPFDHFLSTYLAPGAHRHGLPVYGRDHLTINVRRGDYYSDPDNRRNFGFDIVGYLRVAVPAALERDGAVRHISVISDDPQWCEHHLGFLGSWADAVDYPTVGPVDAFFELVASPRLAMTNSTFSYWAARLGRVLRDEDPGQIWAPRFFDRQHEQDHGLIDPRWSVVESIPGGWAEKET